MALVGRFGAFENRSKNERGRKYYEGIMKHTAKEKGEALAGSPDAQKGEESDHAS